MVHLMLVGARLVQAAGQLVLIEVWVLLVRMLVGGRLLLAGQVGRVG